MPAVQGEPLIRLIKAIHRRDFCHTRVGSAKRLVLPSDIKVPGTTEVILRSGATDGRKFLIAVQIELDLAFSPPIVIIHTPEQVCSHELSPSMHMIKNRIDILVFYRIGSAELSMEIPQSFRKFFQCVVDLIINRDVIQPHIFQCDLCVAIERHLPVAVKRPLGVDTYHCGSQLGIILAVGAGKKVSQR